MTAIGSEPKHQVTALDWKAPHEILKRIPVSEREREQEPSFDLENEAKMSANVGGFSEKMK